MRSCISRRLARFLDLVARDLTPRRIVTLEAIDDAFALDMAMGGSTNTVLHTLALAYEGGVDYPLERINEVAARVPHLCKLSPSGPWHMDDLHRAGGVPAILAELDREGVGLHLDRPTVSGKSLGESPEGAAIRDPEVIRTVERAPLGHRRAGRPVRQSGARGSRGQDRGRR